METILMQNFVTGWDGKFFTLASLGDLGTLHVEAFEDVDALDFKIRELEATGLPVSIAPATPMELYRHTYGAGPSSCHTLTYKPGDNK